MLTFTVTRIAAQASGTSLVTIYYVIGIIVGLGAITGGVYSMFRFYSRQKAKWQTEGEQRAAAITATEANTKAAAENTRAIAALTEKLDGFADDVREDFTRVHHELNGVRNRLTVVEVKQGIKGHGSDR